MPMDPKMVKAKLYNMRSYVESKQMEIDYGICEPVKAFEGIIMMANKSLDEIVKADLPT